MHSICHSPMQESRNLMALFLSCQTITKHLLHGARSSYCRNFMNNNNIVLNYGDKGIYSKWCHIIALEPFMHLKSVVISCTLYLLFDCELDAKQTVFPLHRTDLGDLCINTVHCRSEGMSSKSYESKIGIL